MKNAILVPIDFSENSLTALRYAAQLALRHSWRVHILHTYTVVSSNRISAIEKSRLQDSLIETNKQKMAQVENNVRERYPSLSFTSACMAGNLRKTVVKLLEADSYAFIVMGTKGAGKIKGTLLGSNTFELIKASPIGVLAIPSDTPVFRLEKLGLLTNFKETEWQLLEAIIKRITGNLELALLHVTERDESPKKEDVEFWEAEISRRYPLESIEYVEYNAVYRLDYHMPIPKCIDWMVQAKNVDLLLVSYNRKSFFEHVFSRSLTKALAHNLRVPTFFRNVE